jgi:hypothetical protein
VCICVHLWFHFLLRLDMRRSSGRNPARKWNHRCTQMHTDDIGRDELLRFCPPCSPSPDDAAGQPELREAAIHASFCCVRSDDRPLDCLTTLNSFFAAIRTASAAESPILWRRSHRHHAGPQQGRGSSSPITRAMAGGQPGAACTTPSHRKRNETIARQALLGSHLARQSLTCAAARQQTGAMFAP